MPASCAPSSGVTRAPTGVAWCGCHHHDHTGSPERQHTRDLRGMMGEAAEEDCEGTDNRITAFLADDNLLVREGVRALLQRHPDLEVVGVAADYDELIAGAEALAPQVLVTDIRMPPS